MKIKLSKTQWEEAGLKAGWMKVATITGDGYADGGAPYTNEEMTLMDNQDKKEQEIKRIKEEMAKVIDDFSSDLYTNEGLSLRLNELLNKMIKVKGTQPNPNIE